MQVYPNRFQSSLAQGLKPIYLVFGDEPQQRFEVIDLIRQRAQQEGFEERHAWVTDTQFDWDTLSHETQSMSLFSSKKILELELPTGKPGATGSKALIEAADTSNPDTLLVLHGPKIGRDVQNAKWFKSLDKLGIYVPCFPLEGQQLKQWIQSRCQAAQLQMDDNQLNFLTEYSEGNMLAANQEIEKLSLLYGQSPFSLEQLQASLANHSRFNVFQLVDSLLMGDIDKSIKILLRLESEGVEPNVILWAINKEAQTLNQLAFAQQAGQGLQPMFKQLNIWSSRQSLYQNALNRLSANALGQLQDAAAQCDVLLKSQHGQRPYIILSHLCLLFAPVDLHSFSLDFH